MFLAGAPGASRTFIAVPAGAMARGIVLAGCPAQGLIANFCSHSLGFLSTDSFKAELSVPVAPAGGYTGIAATLSWSHPLAFGEATPAGQCDSATTVSSELSVSLTCLFAEHGEFAGSLVSIAMTCDEETNNTVLEVDSASFTGTGPDLGPPTLISSTVSCFGPQSSRGLTGPRGDADCSSDVSSIDAALVLQFDAGLLSRNDCLLAADVNRDGAIDSRDALLILQDVAGLL